MRCGGRGEEDRRYQNTGAGLGSLGGGLSNERLQLAELSHEGAGEGGRPVSHLWEQSPEGHPVCRGACGHKVLRLTCCVSPAPGLFSVAPGFVQNRLPPCGLAEVGAGLAVRGGRPPGARAGSPDAPALQPIDVLFLPPPAVLSRLLVPDFPPDFLEDPFLCLRGMQGVSVQALNLLASSSSSLGAALLSGSMLPW